MNEKKNKATYKFWCIVINLPKEKSELFNSLNLTTDILKKLIDYYKGCKCYLIMHDKDTNEDGELKTPHIHCVLALENRRSKENILNDISTSLKIPLNCVSADDCKFIQGAVRYLIHYDNSDKYQYSLEDIKTNDDKYNRYFLDFDEYIQECDSTKDVVKLFGAEKANKFLKLILQLQEERNGTPSQLKSQLRAVQDISNAKDITIDNLRNELEEYKEKFDIVKNYVLEYFKNSNSTIYQIVKQSDGDLITYIKNLNKGEKNESYLHKSTL